MNLLAGDIGGTKTIIAIYSNERYPRKLFDKCKFEPCEPFAHYKKDKNSIYLTKLISNE